MALDQTPTSMLGELQLFSEYDNMRVMSSRVFKHFLPGITLQERDALMTIYGAARLSVPKNVGSVLAAIMIKVELSETKAKGLIKDLIAKGALKKARAEGLENEKRITITEEFGAKIGKFLHAHSKIPSVIAAQRLYPDDFRAGIECLETRETYAQILEPCVATHYQEQVAKLVVLNADKRSSSAAETENKEV